MRFGSCGVSFLSCENSFVGICAKRSLSHISFAVEFFQQSPGTFVGRRMDDLPGMLSSRRLRRLQREQSRPVVGDAAVDDLLCGLYVAIREMLKLRQALASRYLALVPLATTALIFQPCPHHAAPCLIYPFRPLLCIEKRGNRFFFFCAQLFFLFAKKVFIDTGTGVPATSVSCISFPAFV